MGRETHGAEPNQQTDSISRYRDDKRPALKISPVPRYQCTPDVGAITPANGGAWLDGGPHVMAKRSVPINANAAKGPSSVAERVTVGARTTLPPTLPEQDRAVPPSDRFTLTPAIRAWIKKEILAWDAEAFSWELVCELVRKKFRKPYPDLKINRQTLWKHKALREAFDATKVRYRNARQSKEDERKSQAGKPRKSRRSSGMEEYFEEQIKSRDNRIALLEYENKSLKQQFIRWQRNAFAAGMTITQLDEKLTDIDRGQEDE
ncbi:hypothetical protein IVA98_31305 [Bradyrhizobium sp. 160]|uniref:hypothetical protein n=1 Tax=Bradyrhizobium sp. 160 TaxID=2782634 RepID=UPI001FFBEF5F|nr:hypothetical protein [Bradyrhizobium sp. 160]MCK1627526.1 hypothetical protein [Bradyrhizobium sp. 160]